MEVSLHNLKEEIEAVHDPLHPDMAPFGTRPACPCPATQRLGPNGLIGQILCSLLLHAGFVCRTNEECSNQLGVLLKLTRLGVSQRAALQRSASRTWRSAPRRHGFNDF